MPDIHLKKISQESVSLLWCLTYQIPKYGKDFSARGRDPLGNVDRKNATKPGQTLALAHFDKLKKSMNMNKGNIKVLIETNELESEYKSELNVIGEDTSDE